eukprot:jgi/Bigna1/81109/fgenesh1_pg.77_\
MRRYHPSRGTTFGCLRGASGRGACSRALPATSIPFLPSDISRKQSTCVKRIWQISRKKGRSPLRLPGLSPSGTPPASPPDYAGQPSLSQKGHTSTVMLVALLAMVLSGIPVNGRLASLTAAQRSLCGGNAPRQQRQLLRSRVGQFHSIPLGGGKQRRGLRQLFSSELNQDEKFEKDARVEAMRRIKAAGNRNSPEEALGVLSDMANIGVMPDAQVVTALVDVFARKGNMAMAMKESDDGMHDLHQVFQQMFREENGLEPDEVTFKILVDGYGKIEPPDWGKISRLLNLMELTYEIPPSTMTYNGLLSICARTKDYERAYELIDRMDAASIEPDHQTLQIVHEKKALRGYLRKVFSVFPLKNWDTLRRFLPVNIDEFRYPPQLRPHNVNEVYSCIFVNKRMQIYIDEKERCGLASRRIDV